MRFEKFFQNKIFLNVIIFFVLFFITDIFYSNFINKSKIKSNCILQEEGFYFLEKDCSFQQKYIRNTAQYSVFVSEFGLRFSGKKFDINKKNIFYFGDSFTYGLGLEYSKTYVGILEKKLDTYNHLNFGLQGYSPLVYKYQLYKMVENNIYPKKIVLALDFTDLFEDVDRWSKPLDDKSPPQLKNNLEKNDIKESFKDKNLKATRILAQSINGFFRNLRLSIKTFFHKDVKKEVGKTEIGRFLYSNDGEYLKKKIADKTLQQRSNDLLKTLQEISKISKKINSDFYILIYPWPDTLAYGQDNFNWENFVSKFCESNCNMLINTFPKFFEYKNENELWYKELYIQSDLHFSKLGNAIIANEILKVAK